MLFFFEQRDADVGVAADAADGALAVVGALLADVGGARARRRSDERQRRDDERDGERRRRRRSEGGSTVS